MKQKTKRKLRVTVRAVLSFLDKKLDWVLIPSKSETVRRLKRSINVSFWDEYWREYYASSIRDGVEKLLRGGRVEVREAERGIEVRITENGKTELIIKRLKELGISKPEKWDGKWRMVFFDVEELERARRDLFRRWLVRLGLRRMQKSVWVYPYSLEKEIKFLREIVRVPHGVKLVTAEKIENDENLREWFDL